jgi:hypothetical protein
MPSDYSYDDAVRRYGSGNVERVLTQRNQEPDPDLFMVFVKPNCRYRKAVMPHSEVMMHFGLAGKPMDFEVIPSTQGYAPSVQLYMPDTDQKFSSTITYGEAGVYYHASKFHKRHHWHDGGYYYFYPNFPAAPVEEKVTAADLELLKGLGVDIL